MTHAAPHAAHHDHRPERDDHDMAEMLDLEAEVLAGQTASIIAWLPVTTGPRGIVDLGSGTGLGTLALLTRFPHAEVTAVDSSAAHLRRLHEKAQAAGLGGRLRIVQADLDTDWPGMGAPDLVWASASLHHMADPDRVLRQVYGSLAPGGLFAVIELAGFPRFLPDDAPEDRPGLEERCHTALARQHAEHVPHRGADWGPRLTAAGFTLEGRRTVAVNLDASPANTVARYALASLRRLRLGAAGDLAPEDLAALDQLLDTGSPRSILRRTGLSVRTDRTAWAARRP